MATNFPTSLDNSTSLPYPSSGNFTNAPSLAGLNDNQNDSIIATQTKIGTGASTPTSGKFLTGTGTGTSAWANTVPAGTVVGTSDTQTLTNKTLTSPTISSPVITNATISTDLITGYTTSNTGTVYGIPITTGVINSTNTINGASLVGASVATAAIASSAITTALINNNAVTSSKLAYGLVYQRQGGNATSWYTAGTTNYSSPNTGNTNIQVGSIAVSTASDQVVTFPVAFTNAPIVTATVAQAASNNAWCAVNSVTNTGFKIRTFNTSGTQIYTEIANWIAVGI